MTVNHMMHETDQLKVVRVTSDFFTF